ncbi:MAG: hypothetical protein ABI763_15135 [Bacteroidota bacterium]
MKRFPLFIIFILSGIVTFAQDSSSVANDVTILYRKENSFGLTAHSGGFGILYRNARHVSVWRKRVIEVEFVSMRHPKQTKVVNDQTTGDAKPFFFGKINYVYLLRCGYGMQKVIFGKAEKSGVEVRYNLFVGGVLGITKPVYNDVLQDTEDPTIKTVATKKYDPSDPHQQNVSDFYGPGSYFEGFGQITLYPGAYGKFSFSFEYSTVHQKVAIIETGIVADGFLKTIPIMAFTKNNPYYVNLFVSLLWGGKKN